MTIVEAVKHVLVSASNGLTSKEVYQRIVAENLYEFPAKNPEAVVNSMIRRHCLGLDFPTANVTKYFKIVSYRGNKPCYGLADGKEELSPTDVLKATPFAEELPEERIQEAYKSHLLSLEDELANRIMDNSPSFFEKLIVDLLIKMGYGYDHSAGVVVGGPHDGGIDGIISEDKLGLDLIYLQAKRYKTGKSVGRQELQAFVGAMQNVQKGVFITTSAFTREAIQYADQQQQKSLKLIDGKMLVSLMIRYEVGIISKDTIKIYRLDAGYFE